MPPAASDPRHRLSVDIGGTFTDVVLEGGGQRLTLKVLTTPRAPEEAVIAGSLSLIERAGLSPADIAVFVHGTTLATNAIIERKGARVALVATRGHRDIIEVADESRYDQYDLFLERPRPLVERHLRFTVAERMDARGAVALPLDEADVRAVGQSLAGLGIESVAVALLHAYANPAHERRVREILAESLPGASISLSSEVSPEIREYERTSTVVANAYVQPLMAGYLRRLDYELAARGFRCPVYLMTSGGGLTTLEAAARFPIRLVESGPAGGAILASHLARGNGIAKALSFDMGGTTAKICLIDDATPQSSRAFEVDRRDRFKKGSGFPLRIPVIEMVEIGAGGGSIARVDALRRITVGPDSAGSEPGPACYGRGGERPTVTDADVALGRIDAAGFAGGRMPLDPTRAEGALLAHVGQPLGLDAPLSAYGVAEMVDETMANAARVHAVERGKVAADYTLIAFGGAAPLHVARLAEKLGTPSVVIPPNAGVGSAVGFLRAPLSFEVVRSRRMTLGAFDAAEANALVAAMREEAEAVVRPGAGEDAVLTETRAALMRYVGQGHEIVVALPEGTFGPQTPAVLAERFAAAYTALFARTIPDAPVEILSWTLAVIGPAETGPTGDPVLAPVPAADAVPSGWRDVYDAMTGVTARWPVHERAALRPGHRVIGPAVIAEDETTTLVTATFDAGVNTLGCIVMTRKTASEENWAAA
ncbi:hydantoinase/oxoprolinase family protein [Alsobacter sp. R-9]